MREAYDDLRDRADKLETERDELDEKLIDANAKIEALTQDLAQLRTQYDELIGKLSTLVEEVL